MISTEIRDTRQQTIVTETSQTVSRYRDKVDKDKAGKYTVTYEVSDSSGNKATATRVVSVYDPAATADTVNPGNKIIYLTFDDGPGKYTQGLLDVLDKYNVKATFFVTNTHRLSEHDSRGGKERTYSGYPLCQPQIQPDIYK